MLCDCISYFFFFKQKTAYEMRISDWSSDVCSSDLIGIVAQAKDRLAGRAVGDGHPAVIVGDAVGRPAQPVFGAVLLDHREPALIDEQIGRASCRERVCPYVYISVVAVSLKKNKIKRQQSTHIKLKE